MRRNWIPKKVLSVILAAALAMSPTITAAASPVDESAEVTEVKETEDSVAEEAAEADEAKEDAEESEESKEEADAASENDSKTDSEEASEEAEEATVDLEALGLDADEPLFEEVDPQEEGLEVDKTALGEEVEEKVETPDPDEQTRVIIVMEGDSVLDKGYDTEDLAENKSAMKVADKIEAAQEKEVEKIEREALDGEELEVNYNFSILSNAVSADVAFKDIEEIKKVDGVEAVYVAAKHDPEVEAEPNTITSGDMVGSYNTWTTGYTGAGTRIAVIDTGIDIDHPSFDGDAFSAHLSETAEDASKTVADYDLLDEEEIANVLPNLNAFKRDADVTAETLYQNEKVAFAFNYVDKNLDITHDNDEEGDHGTHVSGISTANYYVPSATSSTGYDKQAAGVVGIAPDAQLITMKVFGTNGGAYTDDYMAAIEDAILLKADAINLSLGSAAAGESSDAESYINDIFKKLEGTSTVVSISAGNSGRWSDNSVYGVNLSKDVNLDTVGSPGSYLNALTVASAVNSGLTSFYFSTTDDKHVSFADGSDSLAPHFYELDTTSDQSGTEYPFVYFEGKGEAADYEGVDVEGKVVFVSRGVITFADKHMNAAAAGAKAVVIYNNQPGTISMTMQGSDATIPVCSITQADGAAVAATGEKVAEGVYEGTIKVTSLPETVRDVADGYTMSDFSSVGVPGTLDLKPEITAPGGNIFSTRDDGSYGLMSGTSMAAPSIAGQSALVQQYIRENDLAELNGVSVRTLAQSLLMSTATPLYEGNDRENGLEYSPRAQGAGLANVQDAVSSPSYILVGEKEGNDGKVKAVLGDDPEKTGSYSFDFDIYNMEVEPQYYVLDSTVLSEQLYDSEGTTYFMGTSHELNPEVTLTADDTKLVYDLNDDGKVNAKDRKLLLQVANGTKTVDIVETNEDYFDFNKDGVVNTKDVYVFSKALKGNAADVDLGLEVVEVKDSTKISVNINLSEDDRQYLAGFENGMYVDGFIYVNGTVNLSVPFLAFYGSWADSPMFEDFDFMQYVHDADYRNNAVTYSGIERTNFLSIYPLGTDNEMYYTPNYFVDDDKYIADRNAISSENGTKLGAQYYSLMRNASRLILTIKDRNSGEKYFETVSNENYAEFYYAGQGKWVESLAAQDLDWAGTDADGNPLPDGTEVDVTLQAIPAYYDDVEDVSTLTAPGMYLSTPIAIDNTAPVVSDAVKGEDGKYELTLYDNRYVASVLLIGSDKKTVIGKYAVNQEQLGEDVTLSIDAPEEVFYVDVIDYAMNESVYRFNNTGHADTKYVTEVTVDKSEVELKVGETAQVTATVAPKWLAENYDRVVWISDNSSIASVSQSGLITAKKAGETKLTVYTVATDKRGKHLTAEVKVKVVEKEEDDENSETSDDKTKTEDENVEDAKVEEKSEDKDAAEKVEESEEQASDEKVAEDEKSEEESSEDESADENSEDEVVEDQLGGENDD
ncbi:S8 family serine peptidase [Pseudobutyrivibrio xylanivorans]|uniref:S8 family serine peptidase n=1 Tax=Pseudobutyrivibrio xylanivorans TaxID=185007 RepID=A0A5P6VTM1_PSEXY|nr:S8 family serine peptidase [Pseudobutyrivibrio xylanivorans]QFJ55973.1 S8 family serine peptidase [Pseudobutyrivibrio xylanivorans]